MVCSLAGGHVTTLLEGGSTSQIMAEDAGCWKLAAQYIQRELKEADEVNLLDEEDMDVFGLRPMVDPLILVSCNSCKKPVKVSQYANHAEICKSLSSLVDCTTETEVAVKKKPPRKEKKKLQISISTRVASVGKPGRCAIANTVASNSHVNEQIPKETTFPTKQQGGECVNESQVRSLKNFDGVNIHQTPTKLNDHHLQANGMLNVPAPLATKIFYSQRNQRLRSAISHMYYRSSSSSTQHDHDLGYMQFSEIDDHREKDGH
ncbi:putative SAGA-associated factor 73 [Helianthus debilis subsp. tardiflorus]